MTTLFALKVIHAEGLEAGKDYPRFTDQSALFPFAILNCPESYEAIKTLGKGSYLNWRQCQGPARCFSAATSRC